MRTSALIIGGLLATTALAAPALAQSAPGTPPPIHDTTDTSDVDLLSGKFMFGMTEAVMGSGEGAVSLQRFQQGGAWRDNWSGGLYASGGVTYVDFGNLAESFTLSGGVYTSQSGSGATLVNSGGNFTFTARDGTIVNYISSNPANGYPLQGFSCLSSTSLGACAIPTSVTKPNGMKFTINWAYANKCSVPAMCETGTAFYRFMGVFSAAGYSFTIIYESDFPGNLNVLSAPRPQWYNKTGASFANAVTAWR